MAFFLLFYGCMAEEEEPQSTWQVQMTREQALRYNVYDPTGQVMFKVKRRGHVWTLLNEKSMPIGRVHWHRKHREVVVQDMQGHIVAHSEAWGKHGMVLRSDLDQSIIARWLLFEEIGALFFNGDPTPVRAFVQSSDHLIDFPIYTSWFEFDSKALGSLPGLQAPVELFDPQAPRWWNHSWNQPLYFAFEWARFIRVHENTPEVYLGSKKHGKWQCQRLGRNSGMVIEQRSNIHALGLCVLMHSSLEMPLRLAMSIWISELLPLRL